MDPAGPFYLTYWNAAQVRHLLHSVPNPQTFTWQFTTFEEYCSGADPLPQALSKTYALLNTPQRQPHLPCLTKWETDLGRNFTESQKQNMIRFSFKSSLCTKIQETNFKILTRWYLTPGRLHVIFLYTPDYCWCCQRDKRTILHIFWACPKLTAFWTAVRTISQKFTDYKIPNDPAFFLLHMSTISVRIYKKSILCHLMNTAKSCIPLFWKQQCPLTAATWLRKVEDVNRMEDLIMTAQDRHETYKKTWTLWNMFIFSDKGPLWDMSLSLSQTPIDLLSRPIAAPSSKPPQSPHPFLLFALSSCFYFIFFFSSSCYDLKENLK